MRFPETDIPGIADEYVLGLLDASDAIAVEAEIERNGALASAVTSSRERFLPLDMQVEPAELSPGLWDRIEASLPNATALPVGLPVSTTPAPANDNRSGRWRMTALAGMAASLVLAVGLAWSLTRTVEPLVIAVLLNEAGEVQAVVEDFGNETASVRLLNDFTVPADKTIQAWTLPSRDMGPVSLGLVHGSQSTLLKGPALPAPKETQLYEITLEQAGGSPTGRPTGPILAKGFAKTTR